MSDNQHETFGEVRARLDEIVAEVRSKDVSLEKSLDLFEEAIKLGNRCAELVDKPDYTAEEAALAQETISSEVATSEDTATASEVDEANGQVQPDSEE